jgi:hypothetical protein
MTSLRFIKMFPDGLFGGVSGFNVAASMAHIEVNNMPGGGKGNFRTTLGDPNFELMQAWDFDKWWLHIRLGGYAGIGDYVKNNAANWSKDYWSFYPQVRGTVWLDKEKTWSYSLMATYEIPTKMRSYNVTPGHHLVVESSIAHNVNEYFALAASGYYIRETTAASGSDVGWNRHQKYSVWGAGPYAMVFLPWLKEGALIHLAYWTEFATRNRSQGGMFFTELNIPF